MYELFKSTEITVPFGQALIYLSLISSFMFARKLKFILITTYLFMFYWGFILNRNYFLSKAGGIEYAPFIYGFCAFVLLALILYSVFFRED